MPKKLHLVHQKSNVLDKVPSASTIYYGEIAVNYNADAPAIYLKDSNDDIVKFIDEKAVLSATEDAITGITLNGSATTVTDKVAVMDVEGLPDVSSTDNGKILKVVNGMWTLVDSIVTYAGETNPPQTFGNNGDIFLQI